MLSFLKKKTEEYEDEQFVDEKEKRVVTRRNPIKKDSDGLMPEKADSVGKRKRKEPPKPWGRKERIILLVFILSTVGVSTVLSLSARSWKLPGLPRIKLPTFNFFEGETIIVTKKQDEVAKNRERSEVAVSEFRKAVSDLSGVYGVYVVDLETRFSYGASEREIFQAASLIKLPVMVAAYMEEESGDFDLEDIYTLLGSDKVAGSGSLYSKPAGTKVSFRELLSLMGKESDNTAFNIMRKKLGDEKINEVIEVMGMFDTSLSENETTPYDIGIFFENLWNGDVISQASRDEIFEALTDTIYEEHLASGIPEGVRVAHKFGRELHVVNDAGIVFLEELSEPGGSKSRRPFVVVIVSKGVVEREADEVFPELARIIYKAQSSN